MDITTQFAILVPIIIGLTQVVKRVGLQDRYVPVVALLLGVIGAVAVASHFSADTVLQGIVAGLTASGLWSSTKTVLK